MIGHPILNEIKQGFKLRPTKTVDKSKPIFKADGEDDNSIDPTRRTPNGVPPAPVFEPPPPCTAPPPPPMAPGVPLPPPNMNRARSPAVSKLGGSTPADVDRNALLRGIQGGIRLRKAVTKDKSGLVIDDEMRTQSMKKCEVSPSSSLPPPPPPPLPTAPPPPPPMMGIPGAPAPPPVPKINRAISPGLLKLGGATPADVDINELLKGIQGGFRLKKTVTQDKSGLIIDDEMKSKSMKICEAAPCSYIPPPPKSNPPSRAKSPNVLLPESSEDERYQTPDGRGGSKYTTPEPGDYSPPTPRRHSATPEPKPLKKCDYAFEERNLKVTSEDLQKEIKKGCAAARIAKFMQVDQSTVENSLQKAAVSKLPKPSFLEVNNNQESSKPKPVSKWAPVEVGGLKRPSQGNTPLEKIERAKSESRFPTRERSSSALAEPSSSDRARTQSPTGERERSSSTLPAPISIRTDLPSESTPKRAPKKMVKPEIEETPPTPKTSKATNPYSYRLPRSESPASTSPISSVSSASIPSPSSISPGSTSPDVPKRRNPAFDKAKERFVNGAAPAPLQTTTTAATSPKPVSKSLSPRPSTESSVTKKTVKKSSVSSNASSKESSEISEAPSKPKTKSVSKSTLTTPKIKNAATSPIPSLSTKEEQKEQTKKTVKETQTSKKFDNYDVRPQRVINIPINAPWHTPRDFAPESPQMVHIGIDRFATMSPSDFNRNFRFDINLSSDSPLSIINR